MAVSAFDPYAGKRRDVLERIYNENLELAKHSAKSSNSGKHTGCKCASCGSRDYAMTKSGSICTYCRTPELAGSREDRPKVVDGEWVRLRAEASLSALSKLYGLER